MKTTSLLLALPLAFGSVALGYGTALAQATTTTTTQSTVSNPIPGVVSTERTVRSASPNGVRTETSQTTQEHSDGTTTTETKKKSTVPLTPPATTIIVR